MRYVYRLNPDKFAESFVKIAGKYKFGAIMKMEINSATRKKLVKGMGGVDYAMFRENPKLKDNTLIVELGK